MPLLIDLTTADGKRDSTIGMGYCITQLTEYNSGKHILVDGALIRPYKTTSAEDGMSTVIEMQENEVAGFKTSEEVSY